MTERRKDLLYLAGLLALLIAFFSKILFTHQIIRAPDITNEFYWTIKHFKDMSFLDLFRVHLKAGWDMLANGGGTEGGGTVSMQFLFYRNLIFWLFPAPANVAWFIVLHLFFGGAGAYCYCRLIGVGRWGSLLGGLIFALAPENASLINAGHAQKIATISFAPWAFYFLEKGFLTRRFIFPLTTGVCLAFQFFNMHWQIAYYTCLAIGVYGVFRSLGILRAEKETAGKTFVRIFGLNLVTLLFFLSTVAISLVPLADWSKDTNRGVQSGSNQGKGGLNVEEAMSWSLPPEELATFVIPGFFGYSRQEGGYNGTNIDSYYWGRMRFTQTTDYMGLLPWLLLPLPLIFRRDKYTWLALAGVALGILFSMGQYTSFYWFLFEHFPGINRFRVPKMMMIIPVLGLGVLAARGIDILRDETARGTVAFRRYLMGLLALPAALLLLLGVELLSGTYWVNRFIELFAQPTRYEQGQQLVVQRWSNLVRETGIATIITIVYVSALFAAGRRWLLLKIAPIILVALYVADVGRVNAKYLLLQPMPEQVRGVKTPAVEYLAKESKQYRTLPLDGSDPMFFVTNGIPVMFTSNPIVMQRWQNFLDNFSYTSAMPDMLNVRYLVFGTAQYAQDRAQMGAKYQPVYQSPDGLQVILENKGVLPKAWLVPAVAPINNLQQTFAILQNPLFDPRTVALVELPPPFPMFDPKNTVLLPPQAATVAIYEAERIVVKAAAPMNTMLVLGEKYYKGWRASVDGFSAEIYPVNHILRGVYLPQGNHTVEFVFDPLPFKIGKWLTLMSFAFFALMLGREFLLNWRGKGE